MTTDPTASAATGCVGRHAEPPDATVGYLCGDCYKHLRSALMQLPAIAVWLEVNIAASGTAGEKVSGSREDPIPLRVDVTDLVGPVAPNPTAAFTRDVYDQLTPEANDQAGDPSVYDELRSWAALVEEESAWTWDDRLTITATVAYLAAHTTWIAAQLWVDEFADKIHDLTRRAHRVAPWREEIIRTTDPCPSCQVRAVVLHVARSVMVCEKRMGGCGRAETSPYLKQATA